MLFLLFQSNFIIFPILFKNYFLLLILANLNINQDILLYQIFLNMGDIDYIQYFKIILNNMIISWNSINHFYSN